MVPNPQDPTNTSPFYLLGNANTDYDLTTGLYTGAANQQTSGVNGEPVVISAQPNGTAVAATPVTGYRFTTVSKGNTSTTTGTGTQIPFVVATVTVNWTTRGTTNSYSLYALRSPN